MSDRTSYSPQREDSIRRTVEAGITSLRLEVLRGELQFKDVVEQEKRIMTILECLPDNVARAYRSNLRSELNQPELDLED